jgi:hypothetical protein
MRSTPEAFAAANGGRAWFQWDWGALRDWVSIASGPGPLRDLALVCGSSTICVGLLWVLPELLLERCLVCV